MRILLVSCLGLVLALPVRAENPYSGMRSVETIQPFAAYVERLKAAVRANRMGIVAHACATCGAGSFRM